MMLRLITIVVHFFQHCYSYFLVNKMEVSNECHLTIHVHIRIVFEVNTM